MHTTLLRKTSVIRNKTEPIYYRINVKWAVCGLVCLVGWYWSRFLCGIFIQILLQGKTNKAFFNDKVVRLFFLHSPISLKFSKGKSHSLFNSSLTITEKEKKNLNQVFKKSRFVKPQQHVWKNKSISCIEYQKLIEFEEGK